MVVSRRQINRDRTIQRERKRPYRGIVVTRTNYLTAAMAITRLLLRMRPNQTQALAMLAHQCHRPEGETTTRQRRSAEFISSAKNWQCHAEETVAAKRELGAAGTDPYRRSPLQTSIARERLGRGDVIAGANSAWTTRTACAEHLPIPRKHGERHTAHADLCGWSWCLSAVQRYVEPATHQAPETADLDTAVLNRDPGNSTVQWMGRRWNPLCIARRVPASEGQRKRRVKLAVGERAVVVPEARRREVRASVHMEIQAQVRHCRAKRDLQRRARDYEARVTVKRVELSPFDSRRNQRHSPDGVQRSSARGGRQFRIERIPQIDREILCGDWR